MDQDVINLAKAIRERESRNDFNAVGDNGTSRGAYQWQPKTWEEHSKKTFGNVVEMTPENQNAVAYNIIKSWKDQGLNPAQIAAKWNSGSHVGWENKRGYNAKIGVRYDVPAYVQGVTEAYQRIKAESMSMPSQQPQQPPKKTGIEKTAGVLDSIFGGGKIGEMIGSKIARFSKSGRELAQQERAGLIPEGTTRQTFKGPTAAQIGGDILRAGSNFIPVGAGAKIATNIAGKVLPKAAARIAGNVASGAATGYAFDVGENLVNQKKDFLTPGIGTGIGAIIPAIGPISRGIGAVTRETLGITTGTSGKTIDSFINAIKQGGETAKAATLALRGGVGAEQLVTEASQALDDVIKLRNADYQTLLSKLEGNQKTFSKVPVIEKFNKMLDDFKVTFRNGQPDFTRSPGLGRYKQDLLNISKVLDDWGTQQGDLSLVGMDRLKQVIDDFRIGSPDSRKFDAFVTALRNEVKDQLKNEKGYLEMLNNFENSTGLIKELRRGLSLTDRAQTDTTFRKLISVLRTNNDIRESLVKQLDEISGGTLMAKIAGQQLSEVAPRGIIGRLSAGIAGGAGFGALTGGTGFLALIPYFLASSPRLIGELSRALGLGSRGIQFLTNLFFKGITRDSISPGDVLLNKAKANNIKPDYQTAPMLNLIDEANKTAPKKPLMQDIIPIQKNISPQKNLLEKGKQEMKKFIDRHKGEGGFAELVSYKEGGELTTKLLKKLEGRTTVSKQFISDLTNSPDLKQTEKDVIRQVLETEGNTINVADFTKKVKAELLPLERKTSGSSIKPNRTADDYKFTPRYENIALPDELRGKIKDYRENIYNSPIKTSAGKTHFGSNASVDTADRYFGHTRIEDMADNNTRRVIEVQSDLYQKGNLERELDTRVSIDDGKTGNLTDLQKLKLRKVNPTDETIKEGKEIMKREGFSDYSIEQYVEGERKRMGEFNKRAKEVSKLQQYTNPTAHFRMVREELKKASDDGIKKVQFPTGETAMKIEGLGENSRWIDSFEGDVTYENSDRLLKVGNTLRQGTVIGDQWIITDVLGDGKFKAVPRDMVEEGLRIKNVTGLDNYVDKINYLEKHSAVISNHEEQFDISGKVDTNNPIYRFYEKDLGRYLSSKYNAKLVTDAQGVQWYEVEITPEMAGPVEAFGKAGLGTVTKVGLGTGLIATASKLRNEINKSKDKN